MFFRWLLAEWWLGRGLVAARRRRFEVALRCFRRCLEFRPDDFGALLHTALVYQQQGDTKAAERHLRRALQLQPENPALNLFLGKLRCKQQRWGEAEQSFQKCLQLSPKNLLAATWLAITRWQQGNEPATVHLLLEHGIADDAEAIGNLLCFLESARLHGFMASGLKELDASELCGSAAFQPCSLAAHALGRLKGWFYRWLGVRLLESGKAEAAISVLQKAIALRPNDESLRLLLAVAYLDAHKPQEALKMLPEGSTDYEVALYRGAALARLQPDDALKALERADESSPMTHYYRGLAHLFGGDSESAQKSFQHAYELDPTLLRMRIQELLTQTPKHPNTQTPKHPNT